MFRLAAALVSLFGATALANHICLTNVVANAHARAAGGAVPDDLAWLSSAHVELGAHVTADGVRFAVQLPQASRVEVLTSETGWREGVFPMVKDPHTGIWSVHAPGLKAGVRYVYRVHPHGGEERLRVDPYARYVKPAMVLHEKQWAGVVWESRFEWTDAAFRPSAQMRVMEVHPGSFVADKPRINFRELAGHIIAACHAGGFTHVSLMPTQHTNRADSWGYLVGNLFSTNHRHGTPDDLKFLVNALHAAGLAVFFDVVHGHGDKSESTGLAKLDGTEMYFLTGDKGQSQYNSYLYNYDSPHTRRLLLSNLRYLLEEFHADGFRMDAVELPLRYNDKSPYWAGRRHLVDSTRLVHAMHPGFLMVAEDLTNAEGLLTPIAQGGFGFDYKWSVGTAVHLRRFLSGERTDLFYLHEPNRWGARHLHFVNSHDEVARKHGRRPALNIINAARFLDRPEDRFALSRVWHGFLYLTLRGRPMIFQGDEFANEFPEQDGWREYYGLLPPSRVAADPARASHREFLRALGELHAAEPAFLRMDDHCFANLLVDNDHLVSVDVRYGEKPHETVVIVQNWGRTHFPHFAIPLPGPGKWKVALNSDEARFGGTGTPITVGETTTESIHRSPASTAISLPPRTILVLKPEL